MSKSSIAKIVSSFLFLVSVTSILVNPLRDCNMLRKNLFKIINVYHELSDHDREELFTFSLRKMTFDFLSGVEFESQATNGEVAQLVSEITGHRSDYQAFKSFNAEKFQAKKAKVIEKKDKLQRAVQAKFQQMQQRLDDLELVRGNLELFKGLLEKDKAFMLHQKSYEELSLLLVSMGNVSSDSEAFLGVLDKFREVNLNDYNATTAPAVEPIQRDYIYVTNLLSLSERLQKEYEFEMDANLKKDVKNLAATQKTLKKALDAKKAELKGQVEGLVARHLAEMNKNKNYQNFIKNIEGAQEFISYAQENKFEHYKKHKSFLKVSYQVEIFDWQVLRVHPRDLISMPDKLYNLQELLQMKNGTVIDKSLDGGLQAQLAAFYQANNERLNSLQQQYDFLNSHWENLLHLKEKEKLIDQHFAKVVGALQNMPRKCFTHLELSVLLYFSSVLQVIVSKKTFLSVLLEEISEEEQLALVKQLMHDMQGYPLNDSTIVSLDGFVVQGKEKAVQLYSTLIESQIANIFVKQTDVKQKVKGILANVLKYAGIGAKTVALKIGKIGVKRLFLIIASAIATVVLVSFVPLLISLLILLLAGLILKLLSMWLGHLYQTYWPDIKLGISELISRFGNEEIMTLDFDSILENEEDKEWQRLLTHKKAHHSASDESDRTGFFKRKFIEIIQMSVDQNTIDLMDIYDQLL